MINSIFFAFSLSLSSSFICFKKSFAEESYTPSKPVVKFEMELSETMQNQYGKQFKGAPAPGNLNFINHFLISKKFEFNY